MTGLLDTSLPPVLIADDDAEAPTMFVRFFRKMRLANPVDVARDGEEATGYLAGVAAGHRRRPVVVLLDLRMPKKTGLEVLEWVRSNPPVADVPVVMLTGSAEMEEVSRCYELGVASYLVKPVGYAALKDVLGEIGLRWALLPTAL